MTTYPVARIGDTSDHGGVIITSCSITTAGGALIARIGDLHSCPIPFHGVTPILTGSPAYGVEGQACARGDGSGASSVCGCGALIIGGAASVQCS